MSEHLILIAEDEENIRELIAFQLQNEGFQNTLLANDGTAAFEILKDHTPDLIIMDLVMPGKTALDLISEVDRSSRFEETSILLISALSNVTDISISDIKEETSVNEFLEKPFQVEELLDIVHRLLKTNGETEEPEQDTG